MTEYTVILLVGIGLVMVIVGKAFTSLRPAFEKWLSNRQQ